MDVHIRYTLTPAGNATNVIRALDLTIEIPGLLNIAKPFVERAFRQENVRILAELKRYVETSARSPDMDAKRPTERGREKP